MPLQIVGRTLKVVACVALFRLEPEERNALRIWRTAVQGLEDLMKSSESALLLQQVFPAGLVVSSFKGRGMRS